ncbi:MAG: metallophosphoesterase family protein [Cyanobacteria bacterium J06598_1]
MRFVYDPAITTKIARMKERVRWQHPTVKQLNIDQTRFVLADAKHPNNETQTAAPRDFSFLVIGDSGTSRHVNDPPQRRITKLLLKHTDQCDFILHTGDVVYLVGSSEQYPDNFIKPYREFLVGGNKPHKIRFDKMIFKLPLFPVLGNHDYYDLPLLSGVLSKALLPIRRLLRRRINLDVGWHGSYQGEAYARAFLDYTQPLSDRQLKSHLEEKYLPDKKTLLAEKPLKETHPPSQAAPAAPAAPTDTADTAAEAKPTAPTRCLHYVPGKFTRLPNRYYTFHREGIDFFALDTNTFNSPQPLPKDETGQALRTLLETQRDQLEEKMRSLTAESLTLSTDSSEQTARANSLYGKMEQVEEQLQDIDKQLNISAADATVDTEQLSWLRDRLIASWQTPQSKGRVLFFHHPPYVTETTKWNQGQTLAVRARLREVLDQVQRAVGNYTRPLVDLVLSGHAHCFEYIRTVETGHGDRIIPWVVCGGSGFSLRRQRREGPKLEEYGQPVAESHLFIGRDGYDNRKSRPYSALRVEVNYDSTQPDTPQFTLKPLIAERYQGVWREHELDPIVLPR